MAPENRVHALSIGILCGMQTTERSVSMAYLSQLPVLRFQRFLSEQLLIIGIWIPIDTKVGLCWLPGNFGSTSTVWAGGVPSSSRIIQHRSGLESVFHAADWKVPCCLRFCAKCKSISFVQLANKIPSSFANLYPQSSWWLLKSPAYTAGYSKGGGRFPLSQWALGDLYTLQNRYPKA